MSTDTTRIQNTPFAQKMCVLAALEVIKCGTRHTEINLVYIYSEILEEAY